MVSGTDSHVVLVTGASGGVGRGIAIACGQAGWTVWIAARRAAEGEAVADEVTAAGGAGRFVACDAGDDASVQAAIAAVIARDGQLDGAVHNATSGLSATKHGPLASYGVADMEDQIAVGVRGAWLLARHAFPHLKATGGALLVLTSEAGFEGKAGLPVYAGVKAAQRGFLRALAREWGPEGVRVNGLAPLATTPALVTAFAHDPEMEKRVMGRNPLGRLGDPVRDIGGAARFLLSRESAYVTGHTLMADGGACPVT
ncbi:SDR family NAD(P)-dependent oxidoreductase [Sphingomonas jatrophae]|uniref:NAD(P)-dependent dehydrogenase, short-chain alcohol dehydrogenase family n=1 Tax=Sphingomonas jatrophae TaxID=1166337 RepID=A0A1I6KGE2_9SPHN|nr:SDR family oxidoreductase [Sphingomonas jatrophae]SFR90311.1 NAD(P)-dependent dehydrogenase, short-chain alcohol dehydrogenase family [Sphingomonas jatrophae]